MSTETLKFYLSEAGLTNLRSNKGASFNCGFKDYDVEITVKRVPRKATINEEQFERVTAGCGDTYKEKMRTELFGAR